ncbi:MAG: ABC transporter ATP-binding protein/permease [Candidatus Methylumidiphilus sp.]
MIISPQEPVIAGARAKLEASIPRFFTHFIRLAGPFWSSDCPHIRLRAAALVALTVMQVGLAVLVTEWSSSLFNALEQHSTSRLWTQFWLAFLILAANMGVTYAHLTVKRGIHLDWREWLTNRLIGQWMNDGHHCQIIHMPGKHDNPDGRIAEDIRIATEYAIDLCHSMVYSTLLLFGFTKILWGLSGTVYIPLGLFDLPIPGYLVWLALIYSAVASFIGWQIGHPLTQATDDRQTEEANFRFGLARAREHSEAIALVHGETDERRRFARLFQGIVTVWHRQTRAFGYILMFTSGYSVLSMAFPILVASPRYISGAITLGALVQSSQAFQQMASALSWPVDNLGKMAEWRASVERVLGLEAALRDLQEDISHPDPNTILVEDSTQPILAFRKVSIADPDGAVALTDFDAEVQPGERVFLAGDTAAIGKLFKVIAGLWPWGRGRVELPAGDRMFFVPPRPYLPIETLQGAVSYPSAPDAFDAAIVEQALRRVGLDELLERLQETDRWEKTLSREQQQRLGIARMLLHSPYWILLQEALDSLSDDDAALMMQTICEELPDAAILTVTKQTAIAAFHHRQIDLHCPECEMELKKETRKRREQDRRDHEPVTPLSRLLGTLRRDRRKS